MPESPDRKPQHSPSDPVFCGCMGAFLIHIMVFPVVFASGFFGGAEPMVHGPAPADGVAGAGMAVGNLLAMYFMTLGIIPLALSAVGFFFGWAWAGLGTGRTEKDLIFDENLVGCWSDENSGETWCFSKQGEKTYQLVNTDPDGKSGTFVVQLFRVNEQVFMDLCPNSEGRSQNDFARFRLIPVHTFAHVKQIDPTLQMRFPEPDWFRKHVEENPDAIRHEKVDRDTIVTPTTKEMQAFWLKHLDTNGAFGDLSNMKRKVEVAPKDQSPEEETDNGEKA